MRMGKNRLWYVLSIRYTQKKKEEPMDPYNRDDVRRQMKECRYKKVCDL